MRILHTADWHLGRTLEGRSRSCEQERLMDELCSLVQAEAVQLVVVAGDVFDSVNPPASAEELFYDSLSRLSDGGKRGVLVAAGNHDNPQRLCAAEPLAARQGAVLLGRPGEEPWLPAAGAASVVAGGPGWCEYTFPSGSDGSAEHIVVAVVPYPSEARLDEALVDSIADETESRAAYSARVASAFAAAARQFRPDAIRLAVSHLYAAGGLESDSERPIQVGGAFTVHPSSFPADAQYVALGHLHRAQQVAGREDIRYSGSPLAYSFSEAGQAKSVTLLEATPSQLRWWEVPLSSGRPLVRWEAIHGLAEVERWCSEGRDANAWVDLEIHLESPLTPQELTRLRQLHSGLVNIRPSFAGREEAAVREDDPRQGLPMDELFRLFYAERRNGAEPAAKTVRLFLALIQEAAGEGDGKK